MITSMMLALALQTANPVPPQNPPVPSDGPAQQTRQLTDEELDRPICRREAVTGSARRQRVCTTERQRLAQEGVARELRGRMDEDVARTTHGGYAMPGE